MIMPVVDWQNPLLNQQCELKKSNSLMYNSQITLMLCLSM